MGWSLDARYMGTWRPCTGHRQTMCWALVARIVGTECPTFGTVFWALYKQAALHLCIEAKWC